MRNFLLGLVVGALGMVTVVALGWLQITSPRTKEVTAASTTVAINAPQVHQDAQSLVNGGTTTAIDEKSVTGKIVSLDRGKQQVSIRASGQAAVTLEIQADTKIRIQDRDGTFNDLQVGQPVTALYFIVEGKNNCRSLSVEK